MLNNDDKKPVGHIPADDHVRRYTLSAALRFVSAGLQLWGGYIGAESALIVESAEEFTDGLTFAAVAVEARIKKRGLVRKARNVAILFAIGAATLATVGTISEIVSDGFSWMQRIEGISLTNTLSVAAIGAVCLNLIVLALNVKGRKSGRVSDKFAFRDSLRDFIIPCTVIGLSVFRAPHFAEYVLETAGLVYGWYNVSQLYKGWRVKKVNSVPIVTPESLEPVSQDG